MSATQTAAFESYRSSFLEHTARNSPSDVATVADIFSKVHNFLADNQLTSGNVAAGTENLINIPVLITSGAAAYEHLGVDTLYSFIEACKVPEDTKVSCALEVARILSGATSDATAFVNKGRSPGANRVHLGQVYGPSSIAMLGRDSMKAIESFGEYSDRVTSDSRLAVTVTILRSHKSLIDRVLARKASEDPVHIIKIPSPEVYDLDQSQNPSAKIRTNASRQPLITLYRNPTIINTTPQQIVPKKASDNSVPAALIVDNLIASGRNANLQDLTLDSNRIGYQAVDWTDLISDGGAVDAIVIQVTQTPTSGPNVVEQFLFPTRYLRQAQFVTQTNVQDSGDRQASIRAKWNLTVGSLLLTNNTLNQTNTPSVIFAGFTGVSVLLDISFNATLNIKTCYVSGGGSVGTSLYSALSSIPSGVNTTFGQLSFAIIGWSPYLFFSEENMRKTTAAVRLNYKEQEFLIPVGRNFIVDYSLQGQEVGEEVTNTVSEVINIGNSARSVQIISDTMTAVYNRLSYELANPDIDYYASAAQDFAAGTLSLPHIYIGSLDVSTALVMRESERLSDLHSFITSRMLALIADGHNKSMYTENFEPGERARYKVITSGVGAEVLFGITPYWNTLDDRVAQAAEGSSYSLKLPNGTQLDIIKSNFEFFADKMIVIPVRDAKPSDITSFGTILDRGTFIGQYTPVNNGAANKRIVANSREIVFPTNPLGMLITISGLNTELSLLVDGPGLEQ